MTLRLNGIDTAVMVVYLAVVITLGLIMKRRASKDIGSYFLGDRAFWHDSHVSYHNCIKLLAGIVGDRGRIEIFPAPRCTRSPEARTEHR